MKTDKERFNEIITNAKEIAKKYHLRMRLDCRLEKKLSKHGTFKRANTLLLIFVVIIGAWVVWNLPETINPGLQLWTAVLLSFGIIILFPHHKFSRDIYWDVITSDGNHSTGNVRFSYFTTKNKKLHACGFSIPVYIEDSCIFNKYLASIEEKTLRFQKQIS